MLPMPMRRTALSISIAMLTASTLSTDLGPHGSAAGKTSPPAQGGRFSLRAPEFASGGDVPREDSYRGYGCTGRNTSPELRWSGVPAGTKSFALTLFDPDAGHGAGWWHWIVFDIPAAERVLARNAGDLRAAGVPKGSAQGTTSFGLRGYGGPCPPPGDPPHHYIFSLYALAIAHLRNAAGSTSGPALLALMRGHVLAAARLVGRFGRR